MLQKMEMRLTTECAAALNLDCLMNGTAQSQTSYLQQLVSAPDEHFFQYQPLLILKTENRTSKSNSTDEMIAGNQA
jgi:hypothetical protein